MAEDTAEVIRLLRLGSVDVVGHSDGANVALRLARTHPELVRRLAISGANLRPRLSQDELQVRQHWSTEQLTEFLAKFEQRLPLTFRTEYQAVTPDGAAHWNIVLAKSYRLWLTPVIMDSADPAAIQAKRCSHPRACDLRQQAEGIANAIDAPFSREPYDVALKKQAHEPPFSGRDGS